MTLPKRTFGVELEIVGLSEEGAFLALRHHGIPVQDPSNFMGHSRNSRSWRIEDDCSLSSRDGRSAEVVSPILSGEKGLKEVRKVCRAIQSFGGKVNRSCGLHVHVGANDLTAGEIKTLVRRYHKHEDFIDRLVPSGRRGSRAHFCGSMRGIVRDLDRDTTQRVRSRITRIERDIEAHKRSCDVCREEAQTTPRRRTSGGRRARRGPPWNLPNNQGRTRCSRRLQMEDSLADHRETLHCMENDTESVDSVLENVNTERYRHINLGAYYDHGTLEFRQHNGTIDHTKVANWIRFVVNFVEQSRSLAAGQTAKKKKDKKKARTATEKRYAALEKALRTAGNRGLTKAQIARVAGWKTSGVPGALRRFAKNRDVAIEASGQRYKIVKKTAKTVDNGPLMGLPSHVKQYFNSRARIRANSFEAYA